MITPSSAAHPDATASPTLAPASPLAPAGLSPRAVVSDRDVAATYAIDASPDVSGPADFTVIRARDLDDVLAVMQHAQAHAIPVVPQGARTGVVGGAVAVGGGYVLNVEALDDIEVHAAEGYVVAGPGAVNADVKRAAAEIGLFYPPDPASSASSTIGGNVATNAGGLCCVKYGVTADYIRGLQVVLPGGGIVTTGRRTAKGVAGYDLTGLFVGSEGTLGVVTSVVARLIPAPDPALTVLATFGSLDDAIDGIVALRSDRHRPSLLEILDRTSIKAIQELADYGYSQDCAAALVVQSDRPDHTGEDVGRYAGLLAAAGAAEVAVADDAQEADALLEGRRALNAAMEAHGSRLYEDVCVPVGALAELIRSTREICDRLGVEVTMSGHGGDGNLHPALFFDPAVEGSRERAGDAFGQIVGLALDLGGTIAGEHGIGSLKKRYLPRELGEAEMARQRAIKALFDPLGIMNPGRVY